MNRVKLVSSRVTTLALATILAGPSARGEQCTSPPNDAKPLSESRDGIYPAKWCNNTLGPGLFGGLHLDATYWDEGYGLIETGDATYEATCDPNHFLTRLLNAAWIVLDVQDYAVNFGQHRQVCGLDGGYADYDMGWWWNFASGVEPDEWEPHCATDSNATNHSGPGDNYIGLKVPGAYNKTAMYRSAIVVHEPTHEDVGHIGDETCANGGSCDDAYGNYNANTMHINYLYDAAAAYVTEVFNGQPVRPVQMNGGQCGFIPRFTANEREEARNKAENDLDTRFEQAPPPGLVRYTSVDDIDAANGTPFDCQSCDPDKYTFHPNVCPQTACNEVMNPYNIGVNLLNRVACHTYNVQVADEFVTPAQVAAAKAEMQANLHACTGPDGQAARAYCDAEKASANTAFDVDSCGWLDTYHGPNLTGQLGCAQEFCQEKWNQSGGWTVNQDPYLCGEYLCGGPACGSASDEAACKEQVVVMHADPDFYVPQCEMDSCKAGLAACLVGLHKQNPSQWSYGDPIPSQCKAPYQVCVVGQKLAAMVWTEYRPWTDPGPLRQMPPDLLSTQPAKHWSQAVKTFRDAVARGEDPEELGRLARGLTADPEMVAALYNAAPGEFVGLFGKDGFEEVLGPGIARVAPKALDPKLLSPEGQAALEELRGLLASMRDGKLKGAIGTISVVEP